MGVLSRSVVRRWLDKWWTFALLTLGYLGLASMYLIPSTEKLLGLPARATVAGASAIAWIVASVSEIRRKRTSAELREEVSALEDEVRNLSDAVRLGQDAFADAFKTVLVSLFKNTLLDTDHRVSVFERSGDEFKLVARYAYNTDYETVGRSSYPGGEGCLSRAWRDVEADEPSLPDPVLDSEDWVEQQRAKWGVAKGTARRFAMMSRSYAAFALEGSLGEHPVGVLVIECTREEAIPVNDLRARVRLHEGRLLVRFLELRERFSQIEPTHRQ